MTQKRFFGHISGTESPRTKIFALFGSSHMTGPGPSIKNFGVLGEYVELLNQLILMEEFDGCHCYEVITQVR